MPAPANKVTASDMLSQLGERHDELLSRIDALNEQILDALKRVVGEGENAEPAA